MNRMPVIDLSATGLNIVRLRVHAGLTVRDLQDVFGFGTYGTHWIIMEYDGAERAKKGYWKDSDGFWKYVTNRTGKILEANKGYVLGLDLDLMKYNNTSFWTNNIEQVELFFPSAEEVSNISATDVTTSAASHVYDPAAHPGHTDDRTYKDSRMSGIWLIILIPSKPELPIRSSLCTRIWYNIMETCIGRWQVLHHLYHR